MKIFHLGDLHIGKSLNGFSLLEDQAYILDQVIDHVYAELPDAVLIAGDVYDKPTPGIEAVRLFDRFLTALVRAGRIVLVVSGNHDSPERLGFAGGIMADRGAHFYCVFEGGVRSVTLADVHGEVIFHLLPFVRPSVVRRFFENVRIETYQDAVSSVIDATQIDPEKRNVLVAHQFFIAPGVELERAESEVLSVGGIDSVDTSCTARFDYVALGHLHGPQRVGREAVRYCGSPLKYSFSECDHKKSVTVVELGGKSEIGISTIPLRPLRDMRKIRGPIAELVSPAVLSQGNAEDYLHVTLTDEEEVFDAIGALRRAYPNVMALAFENERTRSEMMLEEEVNAEEKDALQLFEDFFIEQNGAGMKASLRQLALNLLEQAQEKV